MHIFPRAFFWGFLKVLFYIYGSMQANIWTFIENKSTVKYIVFNLNCILIAVRKKSFHRFLVDSLFNFLLILNLYYSFQVYLLQITKTNLAFKFFEESQPGRNTLTFFPTS